MANVLITGGSQGIGRAAARLFAQEGWSVAVNYNSSRDGAEALVRELAGLGVGAVPIQADVSLPERAEGLVREAEAALAGEPIPPRPPLAERCDTAVRQFEMAAKNKGEKIACLEARKQYAWYLKGVPHAGYYKEQIVKITTLEDVYRVTKGIKRDLC